MEKQGLVSVTKTERYDADLLQEAVATHFERLGVAALVTPGIRVVLKPNLLVGRAPEACITTHPAVIQAVANWLRDHGAGEVVLADSPGGVYSAARMKSVYHACGMDTITGITLNYDVGWHTRFLESGQVCKSFNQLAPLANAGLLINLAKLKTHGMTTMSAGIKNLFGTIPGLQKPEMHYLYPQREAFCGMLVDLSQVVAPAVTVIDAIEAMEGEGPSGGTVRPFGYLFAACDLYAQDWVAATAMGLAPMEVEMVRIARERGLFDPDKITLVGDPLPSDGQPFVLPQSTKSLLFADYVPGFVRKPAIAIAKKLLRPVPRVVAGNCIGCGRCAESCPPHTITIKNKKAHIDLSNCISCFCCHEMCPVKAIAVKRRLSL